MPLDLYAITAGLPTITVVDAALSSRVRGALFMLRVTDSDTPVWLVQLRVNSVSLNIAGESSDPDIGPFAELPQDLLQ